MSAKPPTGGGGKPSNRFVSLASESSGDHDERGWQRASQIAVVGLFIIALLWCAYVAQHVIVPVLLAWAIATITLPVVKWLEALGMPRVLAAMAVTSLLLVLIVILILILSAPVTYWIGQATYLGVVLREKLQSFNQPMALLQEIQKGVDAIGSGGSAALKVEPQSTSVVTTLLSLITPAISGFAIFVFTLIFYLSYRLRLRNALVQLLPDRDTRLATLRTLNDIDENMTAYFGTFTLINIGLGIVTIVLTWAIGLPNPLLWGVLAAVLNYVPYIGPAIVIGTLTVVGLLTYSTLQEAVVAPLLYLAVTTIEGQFITPTLVGHRLEINPFAVFLAIAFCTWFWGPIGAFLAVPLLMVLSEALAHIFGNGKPDLPG